MPQPVGQQNNAQRTNAVQSACSPDRSVIPPSRLKVHAVQSPNIVPAMLSQEPHATHAQPPGAAVRPAALNCGSWPCRALRAPVRAGPRRPPSSVVHLVLLVGLDDAAGHRAQGARRPCWANIGRCHAASRKHQACLVFCVKTHGALGLDAWTLGRVLSTAAAALQKAMVRPPVGGGVGRADEHKALGNLQHRGGAKPGVRPCMHEPGTS